jgi:regulator of replication initiation timing
MSDKTTYTEQLRKLEDNIEQLSADIKEIKQLLGGSSFGEGGMVKMLTESTKKIEDLEHFKKKMIGYIIGLSVGAGGATSALINLLF